MRDTNPFYFTDPSVGRIASGLAGLFGSPRSEREMHLARADLYNAHAEAQRAELAGHRALSSRLAAGLGDDRAAGWRDIFAAAALTGRPDILRNVIGLFAATQGVPEDELARIVVGGGGDWGRTESGTRFTVGSREETLRRGQDIESADRRYATDRRYDTQRYGIDVEAASLRDRIAAEEAGRNRRHNIVLRPGEVAIVPPDSPLAPPAPPAPPDASAAPASPGGSLVNPPRFRTPEEAIEWGRRQRAALDPAAPDYFQRLQEINNIVVQYTMPGLRPQPIRIEGPPARPSFDQARAEEIERYIRGEGTPEEQQRRGHVVAPSIERQRIANQGRLEQIVLQGEIARELQRLRDEAAAGRLTEAGRQRLEQLEQQNRARLEQIERQNQGRLEQIEQQNKGRLEQIEQQNQGRLEQIERRNKGRLEQIMLEGENARELQRLRDEAAAGRLTEAGRQRLEQLEQQNRARLEQIERQGEIRQRERQEAPMRPSDLRAIDDLISAQAGGVMMPDGNTYRLDPAAIAVIRRRAVELFRSSPDPEVRGNHAEAVAQALEEFIASGPRRSGMWPFSPRTLSPPLPSPRAQTESAPRQPPSPGASPQGTATQRLQQLGIPPPAEREIGRIYQTPIGPMRWDGQRWQRPS